MYVTPQELEKLLPDATNLLSDEPEIDSSLHTEQLALLVKSLNWHWRDKNDYFIGENLTIYSCRQHLKQREFRAPEFFVVRGVEQRPRTSWVVWEEKGKYPHLVIELVSEATAHIDKEIKKIRYLINFHIPEYFWFSPETLELAGFIRDGTGYQQIQPNEAGLLWSLILHLYLGVYDGKLRYFTPNGELVPTPEEAATQTQKPT